MWQFSESWANMGNDIKLPCHNHCALIFREIIETMVQAYSQKIFQGAKPVFDGRKNLYSRDPLPIGKEKVKRMN